MKVENYYCYKFIQHICFNQCKPFDYKNMIEFMNDDFFKILKIFINDFIETDYLPVEYKIVLYDIIDIIKEKVEPTVIESLLLSLNKHDGSREDVYYQKEIKKRIPDIPNKTLYSSHYELLKSFIDKSIKNDLNILYDHLEISEFEFESAYIPIYVNNDIYILSINALLRENEELVNLDQFKNRISCVLKSTENIVKDDFVKRLNFNIRKKEIMHTFEKQLCNRRKNGKY